MRIQHDIAKGPDRSLSRKELVVRQFLEVREDSPSNAEGRHRSSFFEFTGLSSDHGPERCVGVSLKQRGVGK